MQRRMLNVHLVFRAKYLMGRKTFKKIDISILETGDTNLIYLTEQFEQDLVTQGDTKTFLLPPLYDLLEKHGFVFEELSNTTGTQRRKLFLNDLFLAPEEVCTSSLLHEF
jgi:hypothetical protein